MKHPRINVLDTGSRIQNWMIKMQLKEAKFNEVTERIFDVISRVTGTEQTYIPAIIFIGLGRAMTMDSNEVLL